MLPDYTRNCVALPRKRRRIRLAFVSTSAFSLGLRTSACPYCNIRHGKSRFRTVPPPNRPFFRSANPPPRRCGGETLLTKQSTVRLHAPKAKSISSGKQSGAVSLRIREGQDASKMPRDGYCASDRIFREGPIARSKSCGCKKPAGNFLPACPCEHLPSHIRRRILQSI